MDILLILIPLSVVLIALAAGAFVWAARSGQFDGLDDAARLPADEFSSPAPQPRDARD